MTAPAAGSGGRLEAIWVKRRKGGPMDAPETAELVAGRGIRGNANQGGRRQVTILSREAWDAVERDLGRHVPPSTRRANLFVSGVALDRTRGRVLRVGMCRIRIFGETKGCWQMEVAEPGLQHALRADWRAGVFGEVLDDGVIAVGDVVAWDDESHRHPAG